VEALGERRTCLVTGGGRGIGRAVALQLSALGHRVALTARNAEQLTETAALLSGPTMTHPADITDDDAVGELFGAVEDEWGPVDILVASAGAGTSAPVHRTTDEDWQRMLDLNLTAPFQCIRRAVPAMTDTGWGRIVVVASMAAKIGAPYLAAYTAAKHGVLGLVRAAAAELADSGVTVNAVCPGYADTPMTDQVVRAIQSRTGRTTKEVRSILAHKQPIGRLITPEEVAQTIMLCVANGAITGQGINVDGGAVQS